MADDGEKVILAILGGVIGLGLLAMLLSKPKCPQCGVTVERGTGRCPNCLTQLTWQ